MSTEEITQLIKQSQSGDPEKQSAAIFELNELEAIEAIPVLIDLLLSDPNKSVRADAAFILSSLGDQQPRPEALGSALLKALEDDDEEVRANAAKSLGDLHYLPSIHLLRNMLHSDPAWLGRASSAEALGSFADDASIPDLQQAVTDSDSRVQRYAIMALGQFINSPTVAPFVATSLSREVRDLTVKAELLALSYRLGHRSHLQELLALLDQTEDYGLISNFLEVLIDLTDKKSSADISQEDKVAIQKTLQETQSAHPSLLSDIERIHHNLK